MNCSHKFKFRFLNRICYNNNGRFFYDHNINYNFGTGNRQLFLSVYLNSEKAKNIKKNTFIFDMQRTFKEL